jgi:hypothetical protein
MLCALGAVAPAASAAVNTASAFGVSVQGTVNVAPQPTAAMPPGQTNLLASVSVPPTLTTGLLAVTADRRTPPISSLFADASVDDVTASVGPSIAPVRVLANRVDAQCESTPSPAGMTTILQGLVVLPDGSQVALLAIPAPNTVAFNTTGPSAIQVILNEQTISADGELTINAVHVTERNAGIVIKDIIIAQTRCGVDAGPSPPPFVTTDPATNVTSNSAELNATIDAGGSATTYKYEYGPTTAFGTVVPASGTLDAGSDVGDVSQPPQAISGLSAGTTYYYRACANNDGSGPGTANQVCGDVQAFTTTGTSAPSVSTSAATAIANTSAQLNGSVNAHGAGTVYVFEHGTSTAFGQIAPVPSGNAGSGTTGLAVTTSLSALQPRTTYFYRLVAVNAQGTIRGSVMTFTTTGPAVAPSVTTVPASNITQTGALLKGTLNPRGQTTTFTFEYGTTTSFGQITAVDNAGNHSSTVPISLPASGLAPNTTYLYRIVATNATGTSIGAVMSFTTAP